MTTIIICIITFVMTLTVVKIETKVTMATIICIITFVMTLTVVKIETKKPLVKYGLRD